MADNYIKYSKLYEILSKETDDDHILTMSELIGKLEACTGEQINDRTVRAYIKTFKELGLDISDYSENGKGYCLLGRNFEEHEIRILMDCIASCHFITHEKTKSLLSKLEKLGSNYMVERLTGQMYIDNRCKTGNEQIYYNIDKINRAIAGNKKITFNYCHYNLQKQLQPKLQDGMEKLYTVSPVFTILKEGYAYLVSVSNNYEKPVHYRVDRMRMVSILEDEERRDLTEIEDFKYSIDAADYSNKCFKMYSGVDAKVVLKLRDNLLDKVIDELGDAVELSQAGDGYFTAVFTAKYSVGLKRWVLQFGREVKVLEPESLIRDIREEILGMWSFYE